MKFILTSAALVFFSGCAEYSKDGLILNSLKATDVPMEVARDWDWRTSHDEKDQSLNSYKNSSPNSASGRRNKLYLVSLGQPGLLPDSAFQATADYLKIFYGIPVVILASPAGLKLPPAFSRTGANGQEQWFTHYLMDSILKPALPADAVALMAITPIDLYPDPAWNFVFGQASLRDRVGVSSTYRFGMDSAAGHSDKRRLERLIKTASHEFGHMFSMHHCLAASCVMNGSNNINELDRRPMRICSRCLAKLHWNIGMPLRERMQALDTFFVNHGLFAEQQRNETDMKISE
jgi:archaemetzincin